MKIRIFALVITFFALIGCKTDLQPSQNFGFAPLPAAAPAEYAMEMDSTPAGAGEKIMRTARLTIEVKNAKDASERVKGIVVKSGGFVADSKAFEDDAGNKTVNLTLRIPAARIDETMSALKSLGHVREEELAGEDITEQYIDMNARLANSKKLEARLVDLLGKQSKNLKDVLEIERELARVRETIESLDAKKRFYDTRTSLATVEISLAEPPGFGRGIFDPLAGSIQRVLHSFTSSVALLIVVLAAATPWIALLILLAWLTLRLLRFWVRKKREAKAKRQGVGV